MNIRTVCVLLVGLAASAASGAQSRPEGGPPLSMSAELRQLFQAEMRELLAGTRAIAQSLPAGNWQGIVASATAMRDSYVLAGKLTKAQHEELAGLPEHFKVLDRAFHRRTEKLIAAANAKDAETVSFQFSRLLDACVSCHSAYATVQFPGLAGEQEPEVPHH